MAEEKKHPKTKKIREVVTGIVIGGAIGSLLGLILAPKKGQETRDFLKQKSQDLYVKGKTFLKTHQNLPDNTGGLFQKIMDLWQKNKAE